MKPAKLTSKQSRFIDEFLVDSNGTAAAIRAGYAPRSAKVAASRMMSKDNPVKRAIQGRQGADSERLGVFRDGVVNGLMEAINLAREQQNSMAMIRGWAEIGKMMGFYAPETKKVEVSAAGEGSMKQLGQMTDAELLALIASGKAVAG